MYDSKNGSVPSTSGYGSLVRETRAQGGTLTPGRVESEQTPACNTGVNIGGYSSPSLLCSGVDYLRLTCKDEVIATKLSLLALHLANDVAEHDGCERRVLSISGYAGFMCGPVFYGERYDGVMLQVSGEAAQAILPDVLPFAGSVNITRLDLQSTLLQEVPDGYFRSVADDSKAASDESGESGRPWRVQYIDGYGYGDTVYIGSRKSIHFGRVYDKHKESAGVYPGGSVRYEVEFHDEYATAVFTQLARESDVDKFGLSYVASWFAGRGVVVPLPSDPVSPVKVPKAPTSDEKSLRWLNEQVKPTVERLAERGKGDETLSALGIAVSRVRSGVDALLARAAEKRRGVAGVAKFSELPPATFGFDALRQDLINRLSGYSANECDDWLMSRGLSVST